MTSFTKLENKILKTIHSFFLFYMFFAFAFSRSFIGVYIYEFRIGEIGIGLCFLLYLLLVFKNFDNLKSKILNFDFRIINIFLIVSFLFIAIATGTNLLAPYTFKASSYIWTFSIFFLGVYGNKIELSRQLIVLFELILLSIFFISIYDFPSFIVDFFTTYSDKYEPHKGSDLGLFFIIVTLLVNKLYKHNRLSFIIFTINLGFFLPLILYRSRAAFIGLIIFVVYQFIIFNKNNQVFMVQNIPFIVIFIIIASYSTIVSQVKDFPEEISSEVIVNSYATLGEYRFQHYQGDYPLLYFENGRIYSGDGNLNWRLDMWQEQVNYMIDNRITIYGSGYDERLYVFLYDNTGYGNDRGGLDNINENIHNYFVQIFSRGGFIHLSFFLFIYIKICQLYLKTNPNKEILFFIIPLIWISLFDSSMENAHFPIIFYYFLGRFYFSKNF